MAAGGGAGKCLHCLSTAGGQNAFLVGENGTAVPLLTGAASALWRPFHAGAGVPHAKSLPKPAHLRGAHHHRRGPGGTGELVLTGQVQLWAGGCARWRSKSGRGTCTWKVKLMRGAMGASGSVAAGTGL